MHDREYLFALEQMKMLTGLMMRLDIDGLIERMERADVVGPVVDPTLYRQAAEALRQQMAMAKAARDFQTAIRKEVGRGE